MEPFIEVGPVNTAEEMSQLATCYPAEAEVRIVATIGLHWQTMDSAAVRSMDSKQPFRKDLPKMLAVEKPAWLSTCLRYHDGGDRFGEVMGRVKRILETCTSTQPDHFQLSLSRPAQYPLVNRVAQAVKERWAETKFLLELWGYALPGNDNNDDTFPRLDTYLRELRWYLAMKPALIDGLGFFGYREGRLLHRRRTACYLPFIEANFPDLHLVIQGLASHDLPEIGDVLAKMKKPVSFSTLGMLGIDRSNECIDYDLLKNDLTWVVNGLYAARLIP